MTPNNTLAPAFTDTPKPNKEQIQRAQSLERFLSYDQEKMIDLFSLPHNEDFFQIDFLRKTYVADRRTGELYCLGYSAAHSDARLANGGSDTKVSNTGSGANLDIADLDTKLANLDEMASIYELLTKSEHVPHPVGQWESIASLCTNTTDTSLTRYIEYLQPFQGDLKKMQESLLQLGGQPSNKGDVSAVLEVFPGVPVWFQYWEADDEFPASIQFLFDAGITDHFRWSILWNIMTCITNRMKEEAGLL